MNETATVISQRTAGVHRSSACTGVKPLLQLIKLPLSATIALSALVGCLIHTPRLEGPAILLWISTLLLACGCAALNNYQDRHLDQRFTRTRKRPLPLGCIAPERARVAAILLILSGLAGLLLWLPYTILLLGIAAVVCYNGLYTPLKRSTGWAMLPGMVCGMLPPWMGWLTAGGEPLSLQIILVMSIFGVWQIPHFWLVVLANEAEYQHTNLPTPLMHLTRSQLERILLAWVIALATLMLCLPLTRLIQTPLGLAAVLINTAVMTGLFLWAHQAIKKRPAYRTLFTQLNLAVFFSLAIVVFERVIY